jgi:hypothetical protein
MARRAGPRRSTNTERADAAVEIARRDRAPRPRASEFGDACFGKDNIELALLFLDLFEQPVQIAELRQIPLYSRHVGPNLFHRLIEFRLRTADDKDVGALLHEAFCRRQANAAVAARD